MLASLVALLATQLSFQLTGAVPPLRARLWMGAKLLGLALPLAGAAFILFPRIEGPLWGMPDASQSAKSGLTDTMAPGQLSNLAQSEEVAFRVKFDGPVPPQPQLYWRGPVLGSYDGRTWTRVRPSRHTRPQPLALSVGGTPVRYEVTLEPSNTRWLFALEMPRAMPELPGHGVTLSGALEFQSLDPIGERVRYDLTSFVHYNLEPDGSPVDGQWLMLPYGANPRARAVGQALAAESDPAQRVAAVLRLFATDGFVYTLQPPLLPGRDSIDDFLFGTRAGFCEHYAGAFVFLMRSAGVPARVVTGYQGGELNPIDGYVTVRQSDAHAWAEVWLPRRGWVRVDPTAAVAPERVQRSLARALPPPAPFSLEGLGRLLQPDPDSLLGRIRYAIGAVNNGWNQWVLNYTPQRQQDLVQRLQEGLSHWQSVALIAMLCALLFLVIKFSQRRKADPVDALYSVLCQRLGQLGLPRAPDEGPTAYAQRLAAADLAPETGAAATEFLRRYSAYRYGPQSPGTGLVPILRDLLSRVR
jgi:transglutaminase-like putative cysteine protease